MKCPHCGSYNIFGWREDIIETRYKIKKDGKLYLKPFKKFHNGADGHEGFGCSDCGELVNWVDDDSKNWEI